MITLKIILVTCTLVCCTNCQSLRVTTTAGIIEGELAQDAFGNPVKRYLGVPYASPPVGPLRYKHPVPMTPWNHVQPVKKYGNNCRQFEIKYYNIWEGLERFAMQSPNYSEDCLYLNVWTPVARTETPYAVLIFFHGGSFTIGSASSAIYDPVNFVSRENVIVVTANYRVANFGFLYLDHPDIHKNCGLLDQVAAMKWVKDNILQFGGDPNKVTVSGQSAGSISIGFHLVSPLSEGLFNRAILESGAPFGFWAYKSKELMLQKAMNFIENLGCPDNNNRTSVVNCLMNSSSDYLMENEPTMDYNIMNFYPIVDGYFMTEEPEVSFEKGKFKKVQIMTGFLKNEGTAFIGMFLAGGINVFSKMPSTALQEDKMYAVESMFPNANEVAKNSMVFQYTTNLNETSWQILQQIDHMIRDALFGCGSIKICDAYANFGYNTYSYYFVHRASGSKWPYWFGVTHTDELDYIFGNVYLNNTWYNEEEIKFGERIMRYWGNFARTGDPNLEPDNGINDDLIYWPKYTKKNRVHLVLAPWSNLVAKDFEEKKCRFWNQWVPYLNSLKIIGNN